MAKLKGPLMSLGASGKLADTLVFFNWKGINAVREYVIPSNPDTTLQQTQRKFLREAVEHIHEAQADALQPLNVADQVAYAALAAAKGRIMTWFNQAVKLWVDVAVAGFTSIVYHEGVVSDKTAASLNISLQITEETGSDLANGKFYFGTSKTNLINSKDGTVIAGDVVNLEDEDCSAFLTAGKKYYWQFRPAIDGLCDKADSGIYHFVAE